MYYCNLRIHLINCVGMDETIEKIRPMDRFTHEIFTHNTLSELNPESVDGDSVIIINNTENLSSKDIRPYKKSNAVIVLVISRPEDLMESELSLFDYIWTLPLTPGLMRYYFRKLQTDLKAAKDFWLTRNYFDTLINSIPDLIWFKQKDGIHLKVNNAFCEAVAKDYDDIIGYDHCHIWGVKPEDLADGDYSCEETDRAVLASEKTLIFHEEVFHAKRGLIQLDAYKTPIFDEHHNVLGSVGCAKDITALLEQQETIIKMARTDMLTNLTNRRYFYEYLEENRGDNLLTLCYIDLDHFKAVNDNYGHPFGDVALMGAADVLRMSFPDELVTRLGGDEFVVTIIGDYQLEDLIGRLEFLSQKAAEFFALNRAFESLAMSIGVAWTDDPEMSPDRLLRLSDKALYYCKEHNRGGYAFYDDIKDQL